jgi:hypothetical protein
MRTPVTLRFLEEAQQFALRYTCDDCALFVGKECAHGYPPGERSARVLRIGDEIVFCKEFEVDGRWT